MLTRRGFGVGSASAVAVAMASGAEARAAAAWSRGLGSAFARIEGESRGRLGIAVIDTASGRRAGHRADERFPLCSTFKCLASAAVLQRVDRGEEQLGRRIRFATTDLVTYSPVTKDRVGGEGMMLAEICEAALTQSDNTAGNLLFGTLGGPAGLTHFARALGDRTTRLDRIETELNEALPGDPRDTTSPLAMAENLRRLLLGDVLSAGSRAQLTAWMVANKTGDTRLRAGVPRDWRVADKTGAGDRGTNNDVGVLWPPGRGPIVIAVYLTGTEAPSEQRNAAIAATARAVAEAT